MSDVADNILIGIDKQDLRQFNRIFTFSYTTAGLVFVQLQHCSAFLFLFGKRLVNKHAVETEGVPGTS